MAARRIAPTDQPGEVERAPATLIYVPGLGHDVNNSAEVIAESIAKDADRYRGAVTASHDDVPPATPGLRAVATIKAGKTPLLDVTELDYREALEGLARNDKADGGSEGVAPSLIRQTYYALWGTRKWLSALVRRKNDSQRKGPDVTNSKSPMAKFQLLIGLALLLVLAGALAIGLVGVAVTVFTQLGWDAVVPDWLVDPAPWLALTGGLVSAGTLARWRTALLRGAKRTEQHLRYFGDSRDRDTVIYPVTDAIDKLREAGYTGDIHILAYSFGSIVTLDAFATDSRSPWQPKGVDGATSIVTVGSPLDFVNLYFPGHFTAQQARRPELPWANVFIPSDVFGSNFHPGRDHDASDTEVMKWPVANHVFRPRDKLTFWGVLFRSVGLTRHNLYWDRNGGCWMPPLLHQWGLIRSPGKAATTISGPAAAPKVAEGTVIRAVPEPKPVAAAAARKTTRPKPVTAAASGLRDGSAKTGEKKPATSNVTAITSRPRKTTAAKPATKPAAKATRPKTTAARTTPKPAARTTRPKKSSAAKPTTTSTGPKATAKTTAKRPAKKATATSKTATKPTAKRSRAKKTAAAKPTTKPAAKSTRPKTTTARKTSSKTSKPVAAKTTVAKRATAKTAVRKRAAAPKRPANKTTTSKTATKPPAKRSGAKKAAAAKPTSPRRSATRAIPRQRATTTVTTRAKAGVAKKTHRKAKSAATAGARSKSG